MKGVVIRGLALCSLAVALAAPTPGSAATAAGSRAVVAEGLAAVVVDPVTARDRAIVDAKRKAVEQVAGLQVDSRAVYSMGLSQEDWLRVQSFGFVERYEILEERPGTDRYGVKLQAWVKAGEGSSPEAVKQFLSQRSFLVMERGEGSGTVAEKLKGWLVDRGFQVYDEKMAGELSPGAGSGSGNGALKVAGRFLADYLVRIDSSVEPLGETFGIQAFQGSAGITMTEVSTGFLRATTEVAERVFGLTREQAVGGQRSDQFPRAVASSAVEKFTRKLESLKVGVAQSVRLILESPSSPDAFDRLVNGARELRWVQNPHDTAYDAQRAVVYLEYPEKVVYLAADLDYLPGYHVVSYGPGYVVVREEG